MIAMTPDGNFQYNARGATALQALDVGQSLTDTFTYRASDGTFLSSAATVTITVQGRNDAPTAVADTQFTDQNKAIDINVVGNDLDPEKHTLTVTNVVPGVGTVTINTALNLVRYDPAGRFNNLNTGQSTTDSFTYQVSDGHGGVSTGTVVVTIFGLNDPPQAVTDLWTAQKPIARTNEASPVAIPVLANDIDPEGTKLTVTAVQLVGTKGLVTVNNLGSFDNTVTYNPNGKFESLGVGKTATDTFLYTVKDEDGYTAVGTVTVTIDGLNDAPTAVADSGTRVPRNGTMAINVLANDKDIDGDTLQVDSVSLVGTKGLAFRNADNTITYNPNGAFDYLKMGQEATDRFTYTISDGLGGTSTAAVTVTVFGASDPPVAVNDAVTTTEDESVAIDVLFNDTDDFGPKTVIAVDDTGLRGSVVINPLNTANNQVVYSPNGQFDALKAGQTAIEKFTYTVSDGIGESVGTVTVTVKGVNDAPIANIDPNGYKVVRGSLLNANDLTGTVNGPGDDGVLFNDTDAEGDALRAQLVTGPQYATASGFTLNANGSFSYRHNGGISTYDTFTYQAVDANGAVSQQIVTVVISIVESAASDWQNPILRWDVNNDGYVSPIDVVAGDQLHQQPASHHPPAGAAARGRSVLRRQRRWHRERLRRAGGGEPDQPAERADGRRGRGRCLGSPARGRPLGGRTVRRSGRAGGSHRRGNEPDSAGVDQSAARRTASGRTPDHRGGPAGEGGTSPAHGRRAGHDPHRPLRPGRRARFDRRRR